MPDSKGKKRKAKGNWHNQHVKKRKFALCPDLKGFLLFCNNKEKETIREAYVLLNQFADQMYGPEKSTTIVSHTLRLNELWVKKYLSVVGVVHWKHKIRLKLPHFFRRQRRK